MSDIHGLFWAGSIWLPAKGCSTVKGCFKDTVYYGVWLVSDTHISLEISCLACIVWRDCLLGPLRGREKCPFCGFCAVAHVPCAVQAQCQHALAARWVQGLSLECAFSFGLHACGLAHIGSDVGRGSCSIQPCLSDEADLPGPITALIRLCVPRWLCFSVHALFWAVASAGQMKHWTLKSLYIISSHLLEQGGIRVCWCSAQWANTWGVYLDCPAAASCFFARSAPCQHTLLAQHGMHCQAALCGFFCCTLIYVA